MRETSVLISPKTNSSLEVDSYKLHNTFLTTITDLSAERLSDTRVGDSASNSKPEKRYENNSGLRGYSTSAALNTSSSSATVSLQSAPVAAGRIALAIIGAAVNAARRIVKGKNARAPEAKPNPKAPETPPQTGSLPQSTQPKTELPKVEAPKVDPPKGEAPKKISAESDKLPASQNGSGQTTVPPKATTRSPSDNDNRTPAEQGAKAPAKKNGKTEWAQGTETTLVRDKNGVVRRVTVHKGSAGSIHKVEANGRQTGKTTLHKDGSSHHHGDHWHGKNGKKDGFTRPPKAPA